MSGWVPLSSSLSVVIHSNACAIGVISTVLSSTWRFRLGGGAADTPGTTDASGAASVAGVDGPAGVDGVAGTASVREN